MDKKSIEEIMLDLDDLQADVGHMRRIIDEYDKRIIRLKKLVFDMEGSRKSNSNKIINKEMLGKIVDTVEEND